MKKLLPSLIFLLIAFSFDSFAQDIIYKKDGSKEEVKIILVGDTEIQYKKFSNPDGPVYSVGKDDILLITYQNGEYETINQQETSEEPVNVDLRKDFAKNIISYHMFDIVFGDIAFSYERLLSNGLIGFKIPVAFGYAYYSDTYNFNSEFYSGLGVNFYPTGQGKWRYFVGPQFRFGYGGEKNSDYYWYYDEFGNYVEGHNETDSEGFYTQFFFDNGVAYMPIRNFSICAILSIGIRYFPQAFYSDDVVRPDGQFALNISYRF